MGDIRKAGDTYYIEFYARGLKYAQVGGRDEERARELLAQIEKKIADGETLTIAREVTVASFFEQFLIYAQTEYTSVTLTRFKALAAHFLAFLNEEYPAVVLLSQLTPNVVDAYKSAWIGRSSIHKINLSILLLREILDHGIRLGYINDNPTLHVSLLPWPPRKLPMTPRAQIARKLFLSAVPLGKAMKLLKITDAGRIIYFSNLIPLKREEMYN